MKKKLIFILSAIVIVLLVFNRREYDIKIYEITDLRKPIYQSDRMVFDRIYIPKRVRKTLNTKPLRQHDKRWSNKKLGLCQNTIKGAGCALVSITMANNYLKDELILPDEMSRKYPRYVCGYYGLSWFGMANSLGLDVYNSSDINDESAFELLARAIDDHKVIVIQINNYYPYKRQHYMFVGGYDIGNHDVLVIDPDISDFKTLKEANDAGWHIVAYHIYY